MRKYLIRALLILVVVLGLIFYWKYFYTYSEGYRAGLLQKFSSRGTLFKTYEGEIILSSVQTSNDEQVARNIERLQGENVVVHYTEKNGTLPWRGDTRYLVDSVVIRRVFRGENP